MMLYKGEAYEIDANFDLVRFVELYSKFGIDCNVVPNIDSQKVLRGFYIRLSSNSDGQPKYATYLTSLIMVSPVITLLLILTSMENLKGSTFGMMITKCHFDRALSQREPPCLATLSPSVLRPFTPPPPVANM